MGGSTASHSIKFQKGYREKDADVTTAETQSSTVLAQLLQEYSPCEIYDADETIVFTFALYQIALSIFLLIIKCT